MNTDIYCFKFKRRRSVIFLNTQNVYDPIKVRRGDINIDGSFEAYIHKGKPYLPYAYFPDPHNLAITKKFREFLIENNITGWKTFPIEIQESALEYFGLQITGRAGLVSRPGKPGWVTGIKIDMTEWDGSDFFLSESPDFLSLFFTSKVRNALLLNKIFSPEEMPDIVNYEWYSTY